MLYRESPNPFRYVWSYKLKRWVDLADPEDQKGTEYEQPAPLSIVDLPGTAKKFDQGKSRIDLVEPTFISGVGDVLAFGAQKYAAHNWRKGMDLSRLIAAAYRHLGAFNGGEDNDPESGHSHLYHAACCLMFADWVRKNKPEFDDRYKGDNANYE